MRLDFITLTNIRMEKQIKLSLGVFFTLVILLLIFQVQPVVRVVNENEYLLFVTFGLACLYWVGGNKWASYVYNDFTLLGSADGRAQIVKDNQHLHFHYSGAVAFVIVVAGYFVWFAQFDAIRWHEMGLLFGVLAIIGNLIVEGLRQYLGGKEENGKSKVPFSFRDCRFGGYGGFVYSAVAVLILTIIF